MKVPIAQIQPNPFQVRKHYDRASIQALADEIRALGFWATPFRVRAQKGKYQLCFGHRRLEALKLLKWKDVEVEVVGLTDEEMLTQGLVENLQREGLTDLEKAESIRLLIERFDTDGKRQGRTRVAELMGLSTSRITQLLSLLELTQPQRRLIERGEIAGKTAIAAKALGGEEMIATAAKHKLPLHTLSKMQQELAAIDEPKIRAKVTREVVAGKVRDPESVRQREREVRRQVATKQGTKAPPDLRIVIRSWTQTMEKWTKQLDDVLPYLDYIDEDPGTATPFKAASRALIEKLQKFL